MPAPINPKGAKSDKIWRDAIQRATRRHPDDPTPRYAQRLDALADALVRKGLEQDVAAIKEIGDRLDGKPTQDVAIEHSGEITQVSAAVSVLDSFFADQAPGTAYRPDPNVVPN